MPKKRKSGGRSKGGKGRGKMIQCSMCGKVVPRDKAKRKDTFTSFVDPQLSRELRKEGAIIPRQKSVKYYCINCAVHRGVVKIRSRDSRKGKPLY
jgi:small subunit ribosomal protein S26e